MQAKYSQLYEKYRIDNEIGRGASGVCYKVYSTRNKEILVMKKIHVSSIKKNSTRQACSQAQILSKISHSNIIKLIQFFCDESYVYIIMQYASKGDLHQILKRRKIRGDIYSEAEIWEMSKQLLSALEYLHNRNIIHRDVKTLNIFMDAQSKLYLGDLGVSKILKADSGLYSRVGTPLYLAPEIIKSEKYDYKADIWGLGCVIYQLATLTHPFEGKNIINLGQNIVAANPKHLNNYSQALNSFIMGMLEKNPQKRLGATELLKKYFQNRASFSNLLNETKTETKQAKEEIVNRISGGRQFLEMRSNQLKRQVINNYLDTNQKNLIKEEVNKDLDQTILLSKKGEMHSDTKKFVQATRKTNMKSLQKQTSKNKHNQIQQQKHNLLSIFIAEKKSYAQTPDHSHCSKKIVFQSPHLNLESKNSQHFETSSQNIVRLPSENGLSSKMRIRPKSSIMTKERHQSTMKNIRKTFKKIDIQSMDNYVQTCFLKKPQMIVL